MVKGSIIALLVGGSLTLASAPSYGAAPSMVSCFSSLTSAGLSDDAVKDTYFRFLDEIGKTEVTPEVLESILQSGDAFALPEGKLTTSSLGKYLTEFKRMLETHSGANGVAAWNRTLLDALAVRANRTEVAQAEVEVAVAKSGQVSQVVEDERLDSYQPSLVGNWLVALKSDFTGKGKARRQTTEIAFRGLDGGVANATVLSDVPLSSRTEDAAVHYLPTGEFYVAPVSGNPPLMKGSLYDATGKPAKEISLTPASVTGLPAKARVHDIATSPDGRTLLLRTSGLVWAGELASGGTAPIAVRKLGPFSYASIRSKPAFFQFLGNDLVAFSHEGSIQVVPLKGGTTSTIPFEDDVSALMPSADGQRLFVYSYGADNSPRTLSAVDATTGKKLAKSQIKLPTFKDKSRQTPPRIFTYYPYQVLQTPDAKHFVAVLNGGFHRRDRELALIDSSTGEIVARRKYASEQPVETWAFSADGDRLLGHRQDSASGDAVIVWNLDALRAQSAADSSK